MIRKRTISSKSIILPFLITAIFTTLLMISISMIWRQTKIVTDLIIQQDLQMLTKILNHINQECRIIKVKHEKNYIDFLTVTSFVGSEVGGLNLAFAQRWKGPYLKDNPTIQEKNYVLLANKQGYFIVPGDGVVLNNGKKIGVDIILNAQTDMQKLLKKGGCLHSEYGALAAKMDVGFNAFTSELYDVKHVIDA